MDNSKNTNGYNNWSADDMAQAVRLVQDEKMSLKEAARTCNVPVSTLRRRVLGYVPIKAKTGKPRILLDEEELKLKETIVDMENKGFKLTPAEVCRLGFQLFERSGRKSEFCKNKKRSLSYEWYENFAKRHSISSAKRVEKSISAIPTIGTSTRPTISQEVRSEKTTPAIPSIPTAPTRSSPRLQQQQQQQQQQPEKAPPAAPVSMTVDEPPPSMQSLFTPNPQMESHDPPHEEATAVIQSLFTPNPQMEIREPPPEQTTAVIQSLFTPNPQIELQEPPPEKTNSCAVSSSPNSCAVASTNNQCAVTSEAITPQKEAAKTNSTSTGHYNNWSAEDMAEAMRLVKEEKLSFKKASKKCNVPANTLRRRVKGEVPVQARTGKTRILTDDEEIKLKEYVLDMQSKGCGLTASEVCRLGYRVFVSSGRNSEFCKNKRKSLSYAWYENFVKRHDIPKEPVEKVVPPTNIYKRKKNNWSTADMEEAIRLVKEEKLSLKKAGKKCNVPPNSIRRRVRGEVPLNARTGKTRILTDAEETKLKDYILDMQSKGCTLSVADVRRQAYQVFEQSGRKSEFCKNKKKAFCYEWYENFVKRHSIVLKPPNTNKPFKKRGRKPKKARTEEPIPIPTTTMITTTTTSSSSYHPVQPNSNYVPPAYNPVRQDAWRQFENCLGNISSEQLFFKDPNPNQDRWIPPFYPTH